MKLNFFSILLLGVIFTACGESAEERLAREKAYQDSLANVSSFQEQRTMEDSLVNLAKDTIISPDSIGATIDEGIDSSAMLPAQKKKKGK